MEIDTQIQDKLTERFSCLTPQAATALLREVERDKLRGGNTYPHEFVCAKLIQIMVDHRVTVMRLGTPETLFCAPFNIFLVDEKSEPSQRGIISRKSIMPIWNWLMSDLMRDVMPRLDADITHMLLSDDLAGAKRLMAEFHQKAGDEMWAALSAVEEGSREHMRYNALFGDASVLDDALEVARILQIAPALDQLSKNIPAGATLNRDADVQHMARLYRDFIKSTPAHVELGILLIAARLKKPYEILKVLKAHTRVESNIAVMRDPASVSGTTILISLENSMIEAINKIALYEDFDFVSKKITEFRDCAELFNNEFEISPKSLWGNRIIKIRNDLSSAISMQIGQLPRFINNLRYGREKLKSFQQESSKTAALQNSPNAYDVDQALYTAKLLMLAGLHIDQLSVNDALTRARNDSNKFIESISEMIVSDLSKAAGKEKDFIMRHFGPIVEMTQILQGDQLAALLERRGASASRAVRSKSTPQTR